MPRLSVLLPARNAQGTVRRAVTSTLRDLPSDAEVVVLDDGSTDGTGAVLDRIDDARLRVIEGRGEGNLGRALNLMLQQTDSQFVARMDADDVTLPGRFASGLRALHTGADLSFTSALTSQGVRTRPSLPLPISASAFPFHLLMSNPVRHPTLTARRSCLEALGGYRARPSEDYDLWIRAALEGCRLVKTAWFGLSYTVHPGQVSAGAQWKSSSRADKSLQAVFSQLSSSLLGREFPRFVAVERMNEDAANQVCGEFSVRLDGAISSLRPVDTGYLRIKWSRRRVQVLRQARSNSK